MLPVPQRNEEDNAAGLTHCQACGGTRFEWGSVMAQVPIWFHGDDREQRLRLFTTGKETRVRVCVRCGNMQFFVSLP